MFFQCPNVDVDILSVIRIGWQRVNAQVGCRPFHALSYRLEGGAAFSLDGTELLRVEEGEIGFFPANYSFFKQTGRGEIIAIHFTSPCDLPDGIRKLTPRNTGHFRAEFEKLHQVWAGKRPGYEYEAKILTYRILLAIEREWAQDQVGANVQRLSEAMEYISDHISDSALSVTGLSRMAGMSDTYFRKLFRAEYGTTPQKYINRLRLGEATELLRSGYCTVSEIADRCGFSSVNYFSTFIRKETGLSPVSYRNSLLGGG